MARLNTVSLIGNLATEPFLSQTQGGKPKLAFRLAVPRPSGTPRKFRSRDGGQRAEVPDFIGVMMAGRDAERTHAYLRQGSQVLVHGAIVSRDDRTLREQLGRPYEVVEVLADSVEFLGNIDWENGKRYEAQQRHG